MPKEPLEQERFKRRLIAIARSLRKKQLQLQASQNLLNDRWTEVLAAEEYDLSGPDESRPKSRWLPRYDGRALEPTSPSNNAAGRPQFGPDKAAAQAEHHTNPSGRQRKTKQLGGTLAISNRTWRIEQGAQDRCTDHGDTPRPTMMVTHSDTTEPTMPGPNSVNGVRRKCFIVWLNIEEPHTLSASLTR